MDRDGISGIYTPLLQGGDKPSDALLDLLIALELLEGRSDSDLSLSLEQASTLLARYYQHTQGIALDYWELQCDPKLEAQRKQIMPLLGQLGLLSGARPVQANYRYILLRGGTIEGMRMQLACLIELWKAKNCAIQLVMLGSTRSLQAQEIQPVSGTILPLRCNWPEFVSSEEPPQTEIEMSMWLWNTAEMPPDMRSWYEATGIRLVGTRSAEQKTSPPSLDMRMNTWLKDIASDTSSNRPGDRWLLDQTGPPIAGSCLVISHLGPQHPGKMVADHMHRAGFPYEAVGPAPPQKLHVAAYLQELTLRVHWACLLYPVNTPVAEVVAVDLAE